MDLIAFVEQEGPRPTGVAYEFYLNDPSAMSPEQLETRSVFLLPG
jgi:effector-binding domain-containing protein